MSGVNSRKRKINILFEIQCLIKHSREFEFRALLRYT